MQRVLAAWEEHCAYTDLPRHLRQKLVSTGFAITHQQVVPQFNPTYDPNTYSYGLIEIIRAFVAGRNKLTDAEAAEWAEDLRRSRRPIRPHGGRQWMARRFTPTRPTT